MKYLDREFQGPLDLADKNKPDISGVYILVGKNDEEYKPLYIGRAASIKKRLNHIPSSPNLSKAFSEGVVDSYFYLPIEKDKGKEAYEFELELIKYYEPYLNLMHSRFNPQEAIIRAREKEKSSSRKSLWSLTFLSFILALTSMVFSVFISSGSYTPKDKLQSLIITAISNGADLRAIKHIYVNREKSSGGLLKSLYSDSNVYPYNVALSVVLEDIRTQQYLKGEEKVLLPSVNKLIDDHTHINPFDRLEPVQRDYFENIQIKLGKGYDQVSIEVNKLADELYNKNSLVDQYLKDSTTSFWVSVSALLFSILISAYQLYNGRDSRTKRMMLEAYSESLGKDE
ncbi:hypothetical protein D5E88_24405 [Vibrio parahaemolyticus]|uniref:hypothetical protein n=1 Tax=Vibrio parahaemolyticus TaxID=670 RepID=UPI0009EFFADB|nr:hypothetical protein [Vibrio parahaemolyticus]EHK2851218.1 hypothetical protein [Vibrio parahaemolyticus]EKF6654185.1 hypothetical protein [Vibrio parahaemolyticus]ELA8084081.1 hypothetical protein [Vibrio parahaemolyticus]ELA8103885.1 hypothetical protein [Vibrio parahaemolyticus]MDG3398939.1 hypothetical protein [Vibrio parahaemolyticus]